jgi:anti-sigma factor RsiW
MCDDIEPQLSEFVDGDLDRATRATVEAHLETCARCAGLVADFERLRTTARALGPIAPPPGAWTAIAARLEAEGHPETAPTRTTNWTWLAAAAAVVLVASGTYVVRRHTEPAPETTVATAPSTAADEVAQAMSHYDSAIADLQATATSGESKLDPAVAATLKRNLGVLDHAIAESRSAITDDPTSVAARDSLFDALQQKVTVLQDTVALINETHPPDAPAPGGLK